MKIANFDKMESNEYSIPLNPYRYLEDNFTKVHPDADSKRTGNRLIYTYDESVKSGMLLFTRFQLPTLHKVSEDNTVFVFKTDCIMKVDTKLTYLPDEKNEFLVLFYLSVDQDFKEQIGETVVEHKKGEWVVFSTSFLKDPFSLIYPANTRYKAISFFFPTYSLKEFASQSGGLTLEMITNLDKPTTIFESNSLLLKGAFQSLMINNLDSFVETLNFQENAISILKSIIDYLIRNNGKEQSAIYRNKDLERLGEAKNMLLSDLKQAPSIQSLAAEAAMSATKFKTAFKNVYGDSVYQYFIRHRMEVAHEMITSNNQNISEIAKSLGYSNKTHFSRVFKSYFGNLPSKYLKNRST